MQTVYMHELTSRHLFRLCVQSISEQLIIWINAYLLWNGAWEFRNMLCQALGIVLEAYQLCMK